AGSDVLSLSAPPGTSDGSCAVHRHTDTVGSDRLCPHGTQSGTSGLRLHGGSSTQGDCGRQSIRRARWIEHYFILCITGASALLCLCDIYEASKSTVRVTCTILSLTRIEAALEGSRWKAPLSLGVYRSSRPMRSYIKPKSAWSHSLRTMPLLRGLASPRRSAST